jgi:PAS domain S-box-containing protein
MMFRHRLLLRQIRKHLGPNPSIPPESQALLQAIEAAYDQFDTDRKLVERSMELSSRELIAVNARLRQQNEHHLEVLARLRESVRALQSDGAAAPGEDDDLLRVSVLLQEQVRLRNEAEAALKLSDFSVNQASTPTFWVAQDARILRVNQAGCELLGYAEAELVTMRVPDFDPKQTMDSWAEHWRQVRGRKRLHFHTQLRRKDGRLIPLEIDLNWFEFEGREYHFVFMHDITERLQLEEKFRQAQKMEMVGQLSGGIAHDFNNLLTVILGHVGMIRNFSQAPASIAEPLDQIDQAATRAATLTAQLLAFSRKRVMLSQDGDLNELVSNFSNMLRRVIGEVVEVELKFAAEGLPVRADPTMLDQAMLNLCLNARDAMPKGGRLTLTTAIVHLGPDEVRRIPSARAGSFARLTVADTGIGIPPEDLEHLFEPFFTTKEVGKGTGLGLASVYGILQQHQGWVAVQSEVGRGATFSLHLPLREAARAVPRPSRPTAEISRGNETILLVEDELAVRTVANKALIQLGYEVLVACDGREARALWAGHAPEIQLLLTDLVMPGGLGGADIAREFKAQEPALKVVFMSGYSANLAGTDFKASGADYFLAKPFAVHELAAALRQCLDQPPGIAEAVASGAAGERVGAGLG